MAKMAALGLVVVVSLCLSLQVSDGGGIHSPTWSGIFDNPGWWPGPIWPRPWPPQNRCWGHNEVYKKCVSSRCAEMKCGMKSASFMCTADCQSGCYCRDGYYRNQWGQCVSEWECKYNPWNPWTPWYPYNPVFTARPSTYPATYGTGEYGSSGFQRQ